MSIDVKGKKDDKERQVEPEYKLRGYDDMLLDCRTSIYRAMELVPQLYKWLRLVGKYTHKQAIAKMSNDLGDLPGFSPRTMRRYLPSDIPDVPRRIRPKWPKNSDTNVQSEKVFSSTEHPIPRSPPPYKERSLTMEELEAIVSPRVLTLEAQIAAMGRSLALKDEDLAINRENIVALKKLIAACEKLLAAKDVNSALKDQLIAAGKKEAVLNEQLIASLKEEGTIKDQMLSMDRQFVTKIIAMQSKPTTSK